MSYVVPDCKRQHELDDALENISKTIDKLNTRRDEGLSDNLRESLNNRLKISQVYNSNAIEGNSLTLRETELILGSIKINERPLKDELEARSLSAAADYLKNLIEGKESLDRRSLLDLHQVILKNIDSKHAGVLRKSDVTISGSSHTPPSFLLIDELLDSLFMWINRNNHRFHPLVSAAIIHHWLTWIHPFQDGNGRVSRLFLNFYLIQKGYPEIIIKISDRDRYYRALERADSGDISDLVELFEDSIRDTIDTYEEFLNEDARLKTQIEKYRKLQAEKTSEEIQDEISRSKEEYRYKYEIWRSSMEIFKSSLLDYLRRVQDSLPDLDFSLRLYDLPSLQKYLDIMEGKEYSNTWYIKLRIWDIREKNGVDIIFTFKRFQFSRPFSLLGGGEVIDLKTGRQKIRKDPPQVKLEYFISKGRQKLLVSDALKLRNVDSFRDKLSFGIYSSVLRKVINDTTTPPTKIVGDFVDQVLRTYFDVKV